MAAFSEDIRPSLDNTFELDPHSIQTRFSFKLCNFIKSFYFSYTLDTSKIFSSGTASFQKKKPGRSRSHQSQMISFSIHFWMHCACGAMNKYRCQLRWCRIDLPTLFSTFLQKIYLHSVRPSLTEAYISRSTKVSFSTQRNCLSEYLLYNGHGMCCHNNASISSDKFQIRTGDMRRIVSLLVPS